MIYRLSIWLTKWFINKGLLKEEDYDVYVYCLDSLLAKIVFYSVLCSVALVFDIIAITVFYYLSFITFRYTAGGYHAKTELGCSVLSWAVYAINMYLIIQISNASENTAIIVSVGNILFSILVALKYAPIDHFNKPVSQQKKMRLRKYCLSFQWLFVLLTILLLYQRHYTLSVSLTLGSGVAALFLVIAYYQKRGGRVNEKNFKSLL